eukprot:scaffold296165_cov35-Tisochrysis_lutea.AAC.3
MLKRREPCLRRDRSLATGAAPRFCSREIWGHFAGYVVYGLGLEIGVASVMVNENDKRQKKECYYYDFYLRT